LKDKEGGRVLEASKGPIRWLNRGADLLMLRDVTEKKKAERRLHSLFNFALQVNGVFHLDKLKNLLVKHLREIVGDVPIHLLHLTSRGARIESWSRDGKKMKSSQIKVLPPQFQNLIMGGEPTELKVSDIQNIEGLLDILGESSLLLVPVKYKDKPFGLIMINNGKHIDREAVAVVQTMASELAVALENIELFGDLQRALRDLERSYQLTMETLVTALDIREHETQFHSIRVASYAAYLAKELGLEESEVKYVYWGGLLHDIGKIGVPDSILLKPGALTEEEWLEMKKHPEIGYKIIKGISFLGPARNVVLYHHERWDG
jgi:putative nucleotidyltransferase with HDIG domain